MHNHQNEALNVQFTILLKQFSSTKLSLLFSKIFYFMFTIKIFEKQWIDTFLFDFSVISIGLQMFMLGVFKI